MCMSSKGHLKMSEKIEPIYQFSHSFQTVIIKDPKILQNIFSAVTQYSTEYRAICIYHYILVSQWCL